MPTQREAQLERQLAIAESVIARLQQNVTATQMHEQEIAARFREKIKALDLELQLAQRGLTSGCGCPIGQCIRKRGDTGSCWMQWAEAHLVKRMAVRSIDELMRRAVHPGRFRDAEKPELESAATDPALPQPQE